MAETLSPAFKFCAWLIKLFFIGLHIICNMDKRLVIVEKGHDKSYSCFLADTAGLDFALTSWGKSAREAVADFYASRDFMKESYEEEGKTFPQIEFDFKFDVGSLFDYYPLNVTTFAQYIGMNASLLRQYASGAKVPQSKSLEKIKNGISKFLNDFNAGRLVDKPPVQYA